MNIDIIRAWKDEAYRQQLGSEEQALLPANPAGELELSDAELETVHGAQDDTDGKVSCNVCIQSIDAYICATQGNVGEGCKANDTSLLGTII